MPLKISIIKTLNLTKSFKNNDDDLFYTKKRSSGSVLEGIPGCLPGLSFFSILSNNDQGKKKERARIAISYSKKKVGPKKEIDLL